MKAVMTARQHGKSIFGNNIKSVWADEAEQLFEKPVTYLEFNANPLALVCAMLRQGKQGCEVGEVLNGLGTRITKHINISQWYIEREDEDRANEILKYFANKHTMRRIKDEWISEYMTAIDEIIENPCKLNKEHVGILISLPRIYEQNRAQERVIKGHKSAPKSNDLHWPAVEAELEFVERVQVKAGRNNEYHYYWRTPKNYLVRVVVRVGDYGSSAWDMMARHGKIYLSSEMSFTYAIKGYDFNVLQPSPQHMEVNIV